MNGYCKIMLLLLGDFWLLKLHWQKISQELEVETQRMDQSRFNHQLLLFGGIWATIVYQSFGHAVVQCGYAVNQRKGLPVPNAGTPSMQDSIIMYNFPINASFPYQKNHVPVECTAFQARKWIQALGEMGQQLILQQPKATPWSPSKYPSKCSGPLLLHQGLCLSKLEDIEYSLQASGSGSPPH